MKSNPKNSEHFDRWSQDYDEMVSSSKGFPFTGYEDVLGKILCLADVQPGMSVLDLGTGTGNLAGRFLSHGCAVWATDFSSAMLEKAKEKYPNLVTACANISECPPTDFRMRYDRIVSAYAFHHLQLRDKVQLLQRLVTGYSSVYWSAKMFDWPGNNSPGVYPTPGHPHRGIRRSQSSLTMVTAIGTGTS